MTSHTVVAAIGNSDNHLSQAEWSQFINAFDRGAKIGNREFFGFSNPTAPWQNCCLVTAVADEEARANGWDDTLTYIHAVLDPVFADLCRRFKQESIALTIGTTQFITKEYVHG